MRNSQATRTLTFPQSCSAIEQSEIHLWLIDLNSPEDLLPHRELLSPDELEREARFYFPADRRRFVVSHSMLRTVLGGYTKICPQEIVFAKGEQGKPYLLPSRNCGGISFNMAHSRDLALIGVCRRGRIGVDIEYRDPANATLELARRYFAPEEFLRIAELTGNARSEAFFTTWARKEAYIKAKGEGISLGLDTFAIRSCVGARPVLQRSTHEVDLKVWQFWDIRLHPDYAAAMAVEGAGNCTVFLASIRDHQLREWVSDSVDLGRQGEQKEK